MELGRSSDGEGGDDLNVPQQPSRGLGGLPRLGSVLERFGGLAFIRAAVNYSSGAALAVQSQLGAVPGGDAVFPTSSFGAVSGMVQEQANPSFLGAVWTAVRSASDDILDILREPTSGDMNDLMFDPLCASLDSMDLYSSLPEAPEVELDPLDALRPVMENRHLSAPQFVHIVLPNDYLQDRVAAAALKMIAIASKPRAEREVLWNYVLVFGANSFAEKYLGLPSWLFPLGNSATTEMIAEMKEPDQLSTLLLCSVAYPDDSPAARRSPLFHFLREANMILGGFGSARMFDFLPLKILWPHFGIPSVGELAGGKRGTHSIAEFAPLYEAWLAITLAFLLFMSKCREEFVLPGPDGWPVEHPRIIYQATLLNSLKTSYATLVAEVLAHFDGNLGHSLCADHLCHTVALGGEKTVFDMLAFATGQLDLDEGQRAFYLSAVKRVLATASAQEVYAAQGFMPAQPEDAYNVSMNHVVLQSRGSDSRVAAANGAQGSIKSDDLTRVLAVLK